MSDMPTRGTRGLREIASKQQLRLAFLRWAVVTVPFVLLLGFTSARLAPSGSQNAWYAALTKPDFTPPDWAFPAAWSAIYVLLGLVLAMMIHARGSRLRGRAIALFAVQLVVNLTWSPVFFGMHQVTWALGIVGAMFVLTLAMTILFARVRVTAAVLMLPYLAWLVFAGYLNYQIIDLNPGAETLAPSASTTQIIKA
jgi:tryptophan-rich sensory protein